MSKQIINSHKLIHLVSKAFLVGVEECSRYMHGTCRAYSVIAKYTLSGSRQHYNLDIIGEPSLVIQVKLEKIK